MMFIVKVNIDFIQLGCHLFLWLRRVLLLLDYIFPFPYDFRCCMTQGMLTDIEEVVTGCVCCGRPPSGIASLNSEAPFARRAEAS